jgi:hypothetical protein
MAFQDDFCLACGEYVVGVLKRDKMVGGDIGRRRWMTRVGDRCLGSGRGLAWS